jgi:hypothetical protein
MIYMKRTRFIMLAVVVALALMGAGYAAWTQMFRLESNVSTGELFIKITEDHEVLYENSEVVLDENGERADAADDPGFDVIKTETDGEGDKKTITELTFNLSNMYPGTRISSTISFENLGSIKAVASVGEVDYPENYVLWDALDITVGTSPIEGTGQDKFDSFIDAITDIIEDLEPEEEAEVDIIFDLPYGSGDDTENLSLKWTIPFVFEQAN